MMLIEAVWASQTLLLSWTLVKPSQSFFCSFIKINMFRFCKQKCSLIVSDVKRKDTKETQVILTVGF